jgi:hypothetical protein
VTTTRTIAFITGLLFLAIALDCSDSGSSGTDTGLPADSGGGEQDTGGGGSDAGITDAGGADAGGEYAKEAKLTRGPWLGNVTKDGITVRWETEREAVPAIVLGGAASGTQKGSSEQHEYTVGMTTKKNVTRFQHSVTLTGLTLAATISYELPDLKSTVSASFVTAPDS